MPRYAPALLALLIGAAAGALGARHWWQPEPPPPSAAAQANQALQQEVARLEAEKTLLDVDNSLLRNDVARLREASELAAEHEQSLQRELARLSQEGTVLQARLLSTEGQLTLERSAKEHLTQELISAQQDVGALQQNLAFFEQLIPENAQPASVSIRSAEIAWQGSHLRYRILVMRNRPAADDFVGTLEFSATGIKGGSSATISLESSANVPISNEGTDTSTPSAAPAKLQFKQYQRASGFLAIPADFEPESVTVRVLEGKSVRSEHTIGLAPKE